MIIKGKRFRIEGIDPYSQLLIIENREGSTVPVDNVEDAQLIIDTLTKWVQSKNPFGSDPYAPTITLCDHADYGYTETAMFNIAGTTVEIELDQGEWRIKDAYILCGGYTPVTRQQYLKYLPIMIQKIIDNR